MKKLENLEFLTSLITAGLLYLLTYLQYSKGKSYWFIILISAILMTANSYVKYKKIKNI
ncbi:hypothetical protein [Anaerococcus sp. Marseille-P3625]|uniref:hypothetical protein n=1 Tax=Anaerococcus sp. Marseille-P3625 TaxID=1977277 RepID=UPI0015DFE1DE|nr:hypothetical protein [Anaerococcus sp. Marseille-P3625]